MDLESFVISSALKILSYSSNALVMTSITPSITDGIPLAAQPALQCTHTVPVKPGSAAQASRVISGPNRPKAQLIPYRIIWITESVFSANRYWADSTYLVRYDASS